MYLLIQRIIVKARFYIIFPLIFIFSGCGEIFTGYASSMQNSRQIYINNDCNTSFYDENIKNDEDIILNAQLAGNLARKCGDFNKSNSYFDLAEDKYKSDVDLENPASAILKSVLTNFTNDNVVDYKGNVFEPILINTYKGLNFWALGQNKLARVEFNRALDRQRRAKNTYKKSINKAVKKLENKRAEDFKDFNKNQDPKNQIKDNSLVCKNLIHEKYSQGIFKDFKAYKDFVNPFTTYMAGLFFMGQNDLAKAKNLLKESLAMDNKNPVIRADYKLVNNLIRAKNKKQKYIWLIYENGFGASKNEYKLNLPLFIFTNKAYFANFALPTLEDGVSSFENLEINGAKSVEIASLDDIRKTEFKIKLPMVVSAALIRTFSKTTAEIIAINENGYLGFATMVFNIASNRADVRCWTNLPLNFQAARVKNKGLAVIKYKEFELARIGIPKDKNAIILVRSANQKDLSVQKIIF